MIDAHIHFWDPADGSDILIVRREPSLARAYLAAQLRPEFSAAGIAGGIAIQSAPQDGETDMLIARCAEADFIKGVVGWVDLCASDVGARLDALRLRPKFVGVRAMLNRAPTPDWLMSPAVRKGLEAVAERDLSLDLIANVGNIPAILAVARELPHLRIVVDHGATPPVGGPEFDAWRTGVARLGRETRAATKFSGLVDQAPAAWTKAMLVSALDHLLACFGPKRIMWASNWPVIDLRGGYQRWAAESLALLGASGLTQAELAAIKSDNAKRIYLKA